MIYAAYGLVFGLFIPYLARRFSKFMPATPAYALYRILKPVRSVSCAKRAGNPEYRRLMTRYRMRSIGWGIVAAAISYLAAERFSDIYIVWYLGLIWTLLLLTEIDNRMMLLPDILTVPLLIAGFAYSVFVSPKMTASIQISDIIRKSKFLPSTSFFTLRLSVSTAFFFMVNILKKLTGFSF